MALNKDFILSIVYGFPPTSNNLEIGFIFVVAVVLVCLFHFFFVFITPRLHPSTIHPSFSMLLPMVSQKLNPLPWF